MQNKEANATETITQFIQAKSVMRPINDLKRYPTNVMYKRVNYSKTIFRLG
jgi:hypothetical protein